MPQPSRLTRAPRPAHREVHVPYGIRLAASWSWRLVAIAVAVGLLLWAAVILKVLVIPVVIAVLLAALLSPVQTGFRRLGLPSLAAAGLTLVTALTTVVLLFTLVGQQLAIGFAGLRAQVVDGIAQVQVWLTEGPLGLNEEQIAGYVDRAREQISTNSDAIISGALAATTTLGQVVTGFFICLFATLFFLGDGRRIWAWAVSLMPGPARERTDGAGRRAWVTLTAYIRATILVAVADAIGIGLGALILLGPSLAVPIAVLVFVTAFVPIAGAIFSGAVAILVALVTEGAVAALILLAVVIAVQQLESNVMQPILLGRAVALHPLGVALAVTAGILIAGVVGALFAVPIVAVVNTVARYLTGSDEITEEIAEGGTAGGEVPPAVVDREGETDPELPPEEAADQVGGDDSPQHAGSANRP
jgi:putative heme transporter